MFKKSGYILVMLIVLIISFFSCKDNRNDKESAKNDDITIRWENFKDGFENAKIQKKPILMFFYTDWCIYCKKMNSEVFSDSEVSHYMNENFTSIRINPEKDNETIEIMGENVTPAKLMSYTGSNGFPTTLFLDYNRKPITTIPGFIEKKTFLSILKYLKEECYEHKVSLDDYIKNPELCRAKKK